MGESKTIGRHSVYILVGNVIALILSLVANVLITRKLGPTDFGIYSFVISVFTFSSSVAILGLNNILQRNTSFYYGRKNLGYVKGYIFAISKIVLFSTLIISASLVVGTFLFPKILAHSEFILMSIPYFFFMVFYTLFLTGFLVGSRKFGIATLVDILHKILIVLFLYFFINQKIQGVVLANTFSVLIPLSIIIFVLYKFLSKIKQKKVRIKETLITTINFFTAQTVLGILLYLNVFILTYFSSTFGVEQVGFYSLASNIEFYLETFLIFIGSALTPAIIQYYGEGSLRRINQAFSLGLKYTFILIFPTFFSLISISDIIIAGVFSKSYFSSIPVLQILAFAFLSSMVLRLLIPIILAKNLIKMYLAYTIVLLVTTLPITFILVPNFSIYGAALSRVIPLVIVTLVFASVIIKKTKLYIPTKFLATEFLFSPIFLLLFFVPRNLFSAIASFLGLFVAYIGMLFIAKVLNKNDWDRAISLINDVKKLKLKVFQ